jgi:hypothetical protein
VPVNSSHTGPPAGASIRKVRKGRKARSRSTSFASSVTQPATGLKRRPTPLGSSRRAVVSCKRCAPVPFVLRTVHGLEGRRLEYPGLSSFRAQCAFLLRPSLRVHNSFGKMKPYSVGVARNSKVFRLHPGPWSRVKGQFTPLARCGPIRRGKISRCRCIRTRHVATKLETRGSRSGVTFLAENLLHSGNEP